MDYQTVKCFNRLTGAFIGYLGTSGASLSIVSSPTDTSAARCKWHYENGKLYLAKDTTPQDRWLGLGSYSYADWGLTWYKAIVVNDDRTVSMAEDTDRHLMYPYYDYVGWSDDDSDTNIIRLELEADQSTWLQGIAATTPIGDLNLPGTHDSAAINQSTHTPYACHYETIGDQLLGGVRLLDVRLQVNAPLIVPPNEDPKFTFNTCHGDFGFGVDIHVYQTFWSLLMECTSFLDDHGSEFIAMTLKIDDWNYVPDHWIPGVLTALRNLLNATNAVITNPTGTMPTLGNVRGYIFPFDRITAPLLDPQRDPPLDPAIAAQVRAMDFGPVLDIPDNTPGAMLPAGARRTYDVYAQDQYKDLPTGNAEATKLALFEQAIGHKPTGGLLLNFASATQLALLGVYIQHDVLAYIDANRPATLGWSLFDYEFDGSVTSEGYSNCVEFIIASNSGYTF